MSGNGENAPKYDRKKSSGRAAVDGNIFEAEPAPVGMYGVGFGDPARGRGRPVKIEDNFLVGRRNSLISALEPIWPEIGPSLIAAKSENAVRGLLSPWADRQGYPFNTLCENAGVLLEFLQSKEFNRKPPRRTVVKAISGDDSEAAIKAAARLPPRQIAGAMAGIPGISWRRAQKRCRALLLANPVHWRAEEYFRKLYRLPFPNAVWKAAEQGDSWAQYHVGLSYAHGLGVEQDYSKAAAWWRKSAEAGDDRARWELAGLYHEGIGVARNPVEAYALYVVASPPEAVTGEQCLREARSRLTDPQLARAHRLIKKFREADSRRVQRPTESSSGGAE